MSDLAERQSAFLRSILDEDAPLPSGWGNSQAAGMAVYRGNYRSALMGALAVFSGAQLLMLGIIGEYVGRAFLTVSGKPQSLVRSVVGNEGRLA